MESRHINDQALKTNLQEAIDVYLSHVNYCPCRDTVIQLFEGADANDLMGYREHLKTFLNGSKKKKKTDFALKNTQNCINYLRTCGNCGSNT